MDQGMQQPTCHSAYHISSCNQANECALQHRATIASQAKALHIQTQLCSSQGAGAGADRGSGLPLLLQLASVTASSRSTCAHARAHRQRERERERDRNTYARTRPPARPPVGPYPHTHACHLSSSLPLHLRLTTCLALSHRFNITTCTSKKRKKHKGTPCSFVSSCAPTLWACDVCRPASGEVKGSTLTNFCSAPAEVRVREQKSL